MQLAGRMSASPTDRASVLSMFFVAGYTGMVVPTIGIGLLSVKWGLLPALVCFAIAITLAGGGIVVAARRRATSLIPSAPHPSSG